MLGLWRWVGGPSGGNISAAVRIPALKFGTKTQGEGDAPPAPISAGSEGVESWASVGVGWWRWVAGCWVAMSRRRRGRFGRNLAGGLPQGQSTPRVSPGRIKGDRLCGVGWELGGGWVVALGVPAQGGQDSAAASSRNPPPPPFPLSSPSLSPTPTTWKGGILRLVGVGLP